MALYHCLRDMVKVPKSSDSTSEITKVFRKKWKMLPTLKTYNAYVGGSYFGNCTIQIFIYGKIFAMQCCQWNLKLVNTVKSLMLIGIKSFAIDFYFISGAGKRSLLTKWMGRIGNLFWMKIISVRKRNLCFPTQHFVLSLRGWVSAVQMTFFWKRRAIFICDVFFFILILIKLSLSITILVEIISNTHTK